MENINKCEILYEKFLELSKKTRINFRARTPNKKLPLQYIDAMDILKREEIRLQLLKECADFIDNDLNPGDRFDIQDS